MEYRACESLVYDCHSRRIHRVVRSEVAAGD